MSVEYRGQFADRLGTEWTIDVENDDYSSAVKDLVMAGDPLNFEFLSPSDELLYPPVKGSMANFRVISDEHFKYAGLFAQSDFAFPVKIYHNAGSISDWFFPSKDELNTMYVNLYLEGVGGFKPAIYISSTELGAGSCSTQWFPTGDNSGGTDKDSDNYVRPIRSFTDLAGAFNLRDTGPGGGLICYIDGTTYYEAAPVEFEVLAYYSNIVDALAGASGAAIGTGQSNTAAIIAQAGHTASAAKICNDIVSESNQSVLFWSGWIAPSSYSEPYDMTPYTVNIACTDGLGLLKNVEFKDGEDYYNGRMTEAAILFEIFEKIDIVGFKEFVNIYEDNMDAAVGDSPLDQTYIDVDVFRDMDCYEVLEYLLIKWNAIIRQWEGEYIIYRPIEMSAATVYGRKFTNATTKTAVTLTTGQLISRKTAETNYLSIDGGTMTIEPAAKDVIINHDYRYKESWIDNHRFNSGQFRSGGLFFEADWWDSFSAANPNPAGDYFDGETEGVYLKGTNNNPFPYTWITRIQQTFGAYAINANPLTLYSLSFDYAFYNTKSFDVLARLYLIIQTSNGSHYLKGSIALDEWTWTTTQSEGVIEINAGDATSGATDWQTIQRQLIGLPAPGPFIIKVLARYSGGNYAIPFIKNIKFTEESTQLTVKKIKLTKWELFYYGEFTAVARRAAKGIPIFERIFDDKKLGVERTYAVSVNANGDDYEINNILGDVTDSNIENSLEQFAGSLAVDITGTLMPTALWTRRGDNSKLPLLEIVKNEYAQIYSRPLMVLSIPIYDQSDTPTLSLFNNIQDPLNQYDSVNRIFIPNTAEYTVKDRLWTIGLSEINQTSGFPIDVIVPVIDIEIINVEPNVTVGSSSPDVLITSVGDIASGYRNQAMPDVDINFTNSGSAGNATVLWYIYDTVSGLTVDSGSTVIYFPTGSSTVQLSGLTYPDDKSFFRVFAKETSDAAYQQSEEFEVL